MILRAWRGYAAPGHGEAYPHHLLESIQPKLTALAGFRGLYLLRRAGTNEIEYQVLTLWESMDAIHAFAGSTPDRAAVEPEAKAALVRYDTTVQHFEVLAAPPGLA